jgi:hypothetical protein
MATIQNGSPGYERKSGSRGAVLGLSTDAIGDVSLDELAGSRPALKMLLHKYGEYIDENRNLQKRIQSLETELQIYVSYRDGYKQKLVNAKVAALLNIVGVVLIGFGVNLNTPLATVGGVVTLGSGVVVSLVAAFIALRR